MGLRIFIIFFASILIHSAEAQNTSLKFTKLNNTKKSLAIEIGDDIIVQKIGSKGDKNKVRGILDSITAHALVIKGVYVPLDSVGSVIIPFKHAEFWMGLMVPVIAYGRVYAFIAGIYILNGVVYNDNVYVIGGVADLLIGCGIMAVGLLPYLKDGKKLKLGSKWNMETIGGQQIGEDDYYRPPIKKE